MNCNIVKENLLDLFDEDISPKEKDEMLQHIKSCHDCELEYEELKVLTKEIKPKMKVKASDELKSKIISKVMKEENETASKIIKFRPPKWTKIGWIAAVIFLVILVTPFIKWNSVNSGGEVYAATTLFNKSIAAMENLKSIYYNLNIRTLEGDNFELILTDEGFVKNEIWKKFSEPEKWKISKQGREVLMDGQNQYLYIKDFLATKASVNAGFVQWLKILLEPKLIMETEKSFAQNNKAKYLIEEKDNKVILTIKAEALGNFKNDYMMNKSILESYNTRIYTFDKQTNLLLSMQVYIEKSNENILVIDSKEIKYNIEIPNEVFSIELPKGMTWTDAKFLETPNSEDLKNITSEEAARMFFEGCENNDWDKVKKIYPYNIWLIKYNYGGLKIIRIGKAFKSGLYSGEFVPYEIQLKNGYVKKHNIALRNDNKNKVWQVDGGI